MIMGWIWPADSWEDNFSRTTTCCGLPCQIAANTKGIKWQWDIFKTWPQMSWKSKLVWKCGGWQTWYLWSYLQTRFKQYWKTSTIEPWEANCIIAFHDWSWQQWPCCRLRAALVTEELRLFLRASTLLAPRSTGWKHTGQWLNFRFLDAFDPNWHITLQILWPLLKNVVDQQRANVTLIITIATKRFFWFKLNMSLKPKTCNRANQPILFTSSSRSESTHLIWTSNW